VIEVLNVTKSTAAEVSEKLTVAADTEIKINIAREEFRPSLYHTTVIFHDSLHFRVVFQLYLLIKLFCFSIFKFSYIRYLKLFSLSQMIMMTFIRAEVHLALGSEH